MVELVFVIVIVGIIGGLAMRKSSDTSLIEARNQVISHLRYAQHLAMGDEKFVGNREMATSNNKASQTENWQKQFWQMQFHTAGAIKNSYTVYNDTADDDSTKNFDGKPMSAKEIARDPLSGLCLTGYADGNLHKECKKNRDSKVNLKKAYGVEVSVENECKDARFYFDSLGAPYCGSKKPKKLTEAAKITLTKGGKSEKICIEAVTGYIHGC